MVGRYIGSLVTGMFLVGWGSYNITLLAMEYCRDQEYHFTGLTDDSEAIYLCRRVLGLYCIPLYFTILRTYLVCWTGLPNFCLIVRNDMVVPMASGGVVL